MTMPLELSDMFSHEASHRSAQLIDVLLNYDPNYGLYVAFLIEMRACDRPIRAGARKFALHIYSSPLLVTVLLWSPNRY